MAHVPPLDLPLEEVRRELDKIRHPFRLAIRRAKNPFNVGAIVRTAHSFLPREIVLIGTEPFYERAAMGMHRYEHLREVESEEAFVALARAEGWTLSVLEKERATTSLWPRNSNAHSCPWTPAAPPPAHISNSWAHKSATIRL